MSGLDPRVLYWLVWGVGTVFVYLLLFLRARQHYIRHRDPRARRDQTRAFGYLLVSMAAATGVTVLLFGPKGAGGLAAFLSAISSGVFFVVGLYALLDREPDNGGHAARRQ